MKPIRLMLVDDQAILLDVLQRQFAADGAFHVVGVAQDGATACDLARATRPTAAMLDVELKQGESGFDLLPRLHSACPGLHIIMLSLHNHPLYAQRGIELGADAYLDKGVSFEQLRQTLMKCAGTVPHELAVEHRLKSRIYITLTPRELHVVKGVVQGRLTKDIAEEFNISLSTVSTHLQRSKTKLGVKTRAELIRVAAALGIFSAGKREFPA